MSDYCTTLIVPGLNGSGPQHWQTWWETKDRNARRLELHDWGIPDLEKWARLIRQDLDSTSSGTWIVAHSFGCLASLHAAQGYEGRINGLFLVAPADPDKFGLSGKLPKSIGISSTFVASRNDPWLNFHKAQIWANSLQNIFIDLGEAGHINVQSGFGPWQDGFDLFGNFRRTVSTERLQQLMLI